MKLTRVLLHGVIFLTALGQVVSAQNTGQRFEGKTSPSPLNYHGSPSAPKDTKLLSFSDQGAWFSFSIPKDENQGGFSGPFLMTQDNGVWSSKSLVNFQMLNTDHHLIKGWQPKKESEYSSLAGLRFSYHNEKFEVSQELFYLNSKTAIVKVSVRNKSNEPQQFYPYFEGVLIPESLTFEKSIHGPLVKSKKENAIGYLVLPEGNLNGSDKAYVMEYPMVTVNPKQGYSLTYSISFLFPDDDRDSELKKGVSAQSNFTQFLNKRVQQKEDQFRAVKNQMTKEWRKPEYFQLALKSLLTLQNNWRSAAGNLKHSGLFPSYHSNWFQGFWAWDSWKHAAAVAIYDPTLAKDQVLAMYDYMEPNGFIPDDIFRNNLYEENNYRDTKPPLSAWAVWKIYEQDHDKQFLKDIFLRLKTQHEWWYANRDHDQNGLCEYGSTDGTLIAAKWESGMDNAVRFDHSQLVKNSEKAYSLNQESVDLNSYLYAEKIYLSKIARAIGDVDGSKTLEKNAAILKKKIQQAFYDQESGWFYDRNIENGDLIKVMGPEGWLPLWAGIATKKQARSVRNSMMNPKLFNTKVPLPTVNASDKNFKPQGGYWRGPVWIDQAYFGIVGLRNYGFKKEADRLTYKLIHNADGVLGDGQSIRENYNPVTGEGLESQNFSWSAAHYLLLLLDK